MPAAHWDSDNEYEYGGKRKGKAGRPPLRDWREHRWWSAVSNAKVSNWSPALCWIWQRTCKGQAPMITIRGRRVSVRRYLYTVVLPPETVGVAGLDPDKLVLAAESCESDLCVNPHHAQQVSRASHAYDVAKAYQAEMRALGKPDKDERDWQAYCAYVRRWHDTGVQGKHPIEDGNLGYELMQRFDKEYPGFRAEAIAKSREMNRP